MWLSHVWVPARLFTRKVTDILTTTNTDKNSVVCLCNTDLFIQTAGTEEMVLGDGLYWLVRSALWYFRQRRTVIPEQRFRTTCISHLHSSWIAWISIQHSTLPKIPRERRSDLHIGGSLQSRMLFSVATYVSEAFTCYCVWRILRDEWLRRNPEMVRRALGCSVQYDFAENAVDAFVSAG